MGHAERIVRLKAPIARALAKAPPWAFALYGGLAAFAAYFSMFAYRKPFTAATTRPWPAGRSPSTSRSPW
jgi:membrane-associated PAP2 superfamily phosphatase